MLKHLIDRPRIVCHMTASIDGRLHPSRYTESPDGTVKDWTAIYECVHEAIGADAWIVGRVTLEEMAGGGEGPPSASAAVDRPVHDARDGAGTLAVALDPLGRVAIGRGDIGGDHLVVVLGSGIGDDRLRAIAAAGASYIVSDAPHVDLPEVLATLRAEFGVETLLLEGGAGINGSFLAEGLVDELSLIVAPAIDGGNDVQGIVAFDGGLKGKVELSLCGCEALEHGVVHLRYRVN